MKQNEIGIGTDVYSWVDPEGDAGGPDPLKNYKAIGFLSNTFLTLEQRDNILHFR